jgi:transposase
MRILVACRPLDLRKGIDGTAAVCRQLLNEEPMDGALFVFRNRVGTMIRLLVYDGQGFWLMTKRMSQGRFRFWCQDGAQPAIDATASALATLIAGGDWTRATAAEPWRPLRQTAPDGARARS